MEDRVDCIRKVAAKAGVSPRTVRRVLTGGNKESRPSSIRNAARVRAVAEEMGFLLNGAARAMRSGRFGCVALILSREASMSWTPQSFLLALDDALALHNYHLIMAHLSNERLSNEQVVPKLLREWMVDGALVNYTDHVPQRLADMVDEYRMPVVWINTNRDHDTVRPDDYGASVSLTRRLLGLGHRRIAFLDFAHHWQSEQEVHYSLRDRIGGYRDAMKAAGCLPEVLLAREQPKPFDGYAAAERLLAHSDRPTAVLTYGHMEATAVVRAAQLRGLQIPADLSLATFGETPHTDVSILGVSTATAIVPCQAVAVKAVDMLLRKIETPTERFPSESVPFSFDYGRSLGAPAASTKRITRRRA